MQDPRRHRRFSRSTGFTSLYIFYSQNSNTNFSAVLPYSTDFPHSEMFADASPLGLGRFYRITKRKFVVFPRNLMVSYKSWGILFMKPCIWFQILHLTGFWFMWKTIALQLPLHTSSFSTKLQCPLKKNTHPLWGTLFLLASPQLLQEGKVTLNGLFHLIFILRLA